MFREKFPGLPECATEELYNLTSSLCDHNVQIPGHVLQQRPSFFERIPGRPGQVFGLLHVVPKETVAARPPPYIFFRGEVDGGGGIEIRRATAKQQVSALHLGAVAIRNTWRFLADILSWSMPFPCRTPSRRTSRTGH